MTTLLQHPRHGLYQASAAPCMTWRWPRPPRQNAIAITAPLSPLSGLPYYMSLQTQPRAADKTLMTVLQGLAVQAYHLRRYGLPTGFCQAL